MQLPEISLYYKEGSSDKEYHLKVEVDKPETLPASGASVNLYNVTCAYGRTGTALKVETKTNSPVLLVDAKALYEKTVREKKAKGYTESETGKAFALGERAGQVSGLLPMLPTAVVDEELPALLDSYEWAMEEKKDGVHLMVRVTEEIGFSPRGDTAFPGNKKVEASNKKGLITSLSPALEADLKKLRPCVLDGELIGEDYYIFDILSWDNKDLTFLGYGARSRLLKVALGDLIINLDHLHGEPATWIPQEKRDFFIQLLQAGAEGVVFKKKDAPYAVGKAPSGGVIRKYKFYNTAHVIVSQTNNQRSVQMQSYEGIELGSVTISSNQKIPIKGTVIEVRYLNWNKGGSLFQPLYLGERADVDPEECTLGQLKEKK